MLMSASVCLQLLDFFLTFIDLQKSVPSKLDKNQTLSTTSESIFGDALFTDIGGQLRAWASFKQSMVKHKCMKREKLCLGVTVSA